MKIRNLLDILGRWIVPFVRWEKDPAGLLVGDYDSDVSNILVALNITPKVIEEAISRNCSTIITHHPLFFKPLSKLIKNSYYGDMVIKLIMSKINLISFHTCFDLMPGGVSFILGNRIGLKDVEIMLPYAQLKGVNDQNLQKIIIHAPLEYEATIKKVICDSGGGSLGNYDNYCFSSRGKTSFSPQKNAKPYIGNFNESNIVDEVAIHTIIPSWQTASLLDSIKAVHPYEMPAIDILDLKNSLYGYGLGAVGNLDKKVSLGTVLENISKKLETDFLRYGKDNLDKKINRIAVCGGAGGRYWNAAIHKGADLYLTSEVSHHDFLEAEGLITLVDASHYATENLAILELFNYLKENTNRNIKISQLDYDPILVYKNKKK